MGRFRGDKTAVLNGMSRVENGEYRGPGNGLRAAIPVR